MLASYEEVGVPSEVTDVVGLDFEARMEVSATVDGFLQPSKPHLHVLLLPPTSCHPVFLLIVVAAHTSLIKTSYKSFMTILSSWSLGVGT